MKTVAVFFDEAGTFAYPFTKKKYIRHIAQLGEAIEACGANFRVVRHQSSYLGSGEFAQSWELRDGEVIETGPVKADVIFDKGLFSSDGTIPVLNCQEINEICTNKYKTFQLFSDYSPQTYLVNSQEEFLDALLNIPGQYKVVKPLDGLEARNVHIGDDEFLKKQDCPYPFLVQEFLDSRSGIPGIVNGVHDFRVALLNGEIVHSIVRTPASGKLVASVTEGGEMRVVEIELIPSTVLDLVEQIEKHMVQYGTRFYGIDLALVNGQPKIIELNSRVSIWDNQQHQVFASTKRKLAEVLVSL
ncbi:MAG: ATP-grasp domain-containing protein [Moorea sp. SIO4A1]|uniref:ATP-grasp domain-containing protein n=1 Tax=Moorena sp. SIO4A1 TaxID=2607835 RepID=UPI00144EE853|nr:ATP-grasp domain-containing protein [Moorena sp. SIO4A1]NEQ59536.1 ATP-grasp domain-containing protein [Moorena sp. SIO4A1]